MHSLLAHSLEGSCRSLYRMVPFTAANIPRLRPLGSPPSAVKPALTSRCSLGCHTLCATDPFHASVIGHTSLQSWQRCIPFVIHRIPQLVKRVRATGVCPSTSRKAVHGALPLYIHHSPCSLDVDGTAAYAAAWIVPYFEEQHR